MTVLEFETMDTRLHNRFCDGLKERHLAWTPLDSKTALPPVEQAMGTIGIDPPDRSSATEGSG